MLRSLSRSSVALSVALCGACLFSTGPQLPRDTPNWLRQLIKELASQPVTNPPASITAFTYRDQTVYFLPAHCCDYPSLLYDPEGAMLCSPDGGITGQGDGRCPDFLTARRDPRLIWTDPRGTKQ
jgi:hypothetical protein